MAVDVADVDVAAQLASSNVNLDPEAAAKLRFVRFTVLTARVPNNVPLDER